MAEPEALIRTALGPDVVPFEYELSGRAHRGWHGANPLPTAEAHTQVSRHIESFDRADVRLFAGDTNLGGLALPRQTEAGIYGYPLIALPGLPVPDVAAFARVGGGGDPPLDFDDMEELARLTPGSPVTALFLARSDECRRKWKPRKDFKADWPNAVHRMLARIYDRHRFLIHFADSKGLHARFVDPVTGEAALEFAELILEVNIEAADVMGDTDAAGVAEYIAAHQGFKLWWD